MRRIRSRWPRSGAARWAVSCWYRRRRARQRSDVRRSAVPAADRAQDGQEPRPPGRLRRRGRTTSGFGGPRSGRIPAGARHPCRSGRQRVLRVLRPRRRPRARVFAVCIDSSRPEELAQWWADELGAGVQPGPDGTPRWLYGAAGSPGLIWKFVRVHDPRVGPNRWQWRVRGGPMKDVADGPGGVWRDPQGNEFGFT